MSGTSTSVSGGGVGVGMGYGYGYRPPPFTAVQWQELEHQAMIYKYLVAGVPVPPDLVVPIRRSFETLSSRFFHHPSLGYCSYYGKKFDPEPGRCRRTDGKKWRCSKDAYPDSKYCERHMHRGRNRSRKPVESQSAASQPSSAAMSHITSGSSVTSGSFQSTDRSFQNMPLYPIANSEGLCYGSSAAATKLQTECASYGRESKDFWYTPGMNPNGDEHNFPPETSAASVGRLGMGSTNIDNTWHPVPFQVSSSPMLKLKNESLLLGSSSTNMHLPGVYEPIADATIPKQHCLFGSDINSPGTVKHEQQQSMHPFFSEWPATKESWFNLNGDGSNRTQLSMSIPTATSDFSSRNTTSQNDA